MSYIAIKHILFASKLKVEKEKQKSFGCPCCPSGGPLTVKVLLNKNGVVPGEYIQMKVDVCV